MTRRAAFRRRRAGGIPGVVLAVVFVLWGLGALGAMVADWAVDARPGVATGLLFLAGGLGMLSGRRPGERLASVALTAQLIVTILSTGLAVAAGFGSASTLGYAVAAGAVHAGACLLAILWLRRPACR